MVTGPTWRTQVPLQIGEVIADFTNQPYAPGQTNDCTTEDLSQRARYGR